MKTFLVVLSCVILAIAIIVSSNYIYTNYKAAQYEDRAVPYLNMVIPEISKWEAETIKKYMPAESLAKTPDENINKIVNYLARLGALKAFAEPVFEKVDSGKAVADREKVVVTYSIDAEYENGPAVITINLLEAGDSFLVHNFNFNSEVL